MKKYKDIKMALLDFEQAAIKHTEAKMLGDYKTCNRPLAKVINEFVKF